MTTEEHEPVNRYVLHELESVTVRPLQSIVDRAADAGAAIAAGHQPGCERQDGEKVGRRTVHPGEKCGNRGRPPHKNLAARAAPVLRRRGAIVDSTTVIG